MRAREWKQTIEARLEELDRIEEDERKAVASQRERLLEELDGLEKMSADIEVRYEIRRLELKGLLRIDAVRGGDDEPEDEADNGEE